MLVRSARVDVLAVTAVTADLVRLVAVVDQRCVVDAVLLGGVSDTYLQLVREVLAGLLGKFVEASEAVPAVVLADTHYVR